MKPIGKIIDFQHGLINAISPSSPGYPEGAAFVSTNSRIDKDGLWNKGPTTGNVATALAPTTIPSETGTHFAYLSILGNDIIADSGSSALTITEGPNGYAYYSKSGAVKSWNGSDNSGDASIGLTPDSQEPSVSVSGTGARQEEGLYYYLYTIYNATKDVESLPGGSSSKHWVIEHWVGKRYESDARIADVPLLGAITSSGNRIRWYRSLKIDIAKGDTMQLGQENSPLKFYFVGEVASGATFADYAHDREIENDNRLFTGRGGLPPTSGVDAVAKFDNRLFYFIDGGCWWSSAGRPEEVPKTFDLYVRHDYSGGLWSTGTFNNKLTKAVTPTYSTLTRFPLLDTGVFGEARMRIPELSGDQVRFAKEIGDKLWVWTQDTTGYIVKTGKSEGYRYVLVARGIGAINQWVIAETPYGIFGADAKGIWVIKGTEPQRLSDGIIDIDDSGKDTYVSTGSQSNSFGVWVDLLNEYWWSAGSSVQIAYQADRQRFVGPYSLNIAGGTFYSIDGTTECYLTLGVTPILSSRTGLQTLKFWMGQESSNFIKDNLDIEVIYTSMTADQNVTAITYQNKIASETGAMSSDGWTHNDDDLLGVISPLGSGRYFSLYLSIPSACTAPIAAINYYANLVHKNERARL